MQPLNRSKADDICAFGQIVYVYVQQVGAFDAVVAILQHRAARNIGHDIIYAYAGFRHEMQHIVIGGGVRAGFKVEDIG